MRKINVKKMERILRDFFGNFRHFFFFLHRNLSSSERGEEVFSNFESPRPLQKLKFKLPSLSIFSPFPLLFALLIHLSFFGNPTQSLTTFSHILIHFSLHYSSLSHLLIFNFATLSFIFFSEALNQKSNVDWTIPFHDL